MKLLDRLVLAACIGAFTAFACACSQTSEQNSSPDTTTTAKTVKPTPEKVELKTYEFPEFLNSLKTADVLSNSVYVSFNADTALVNVEKQPFEDYTCTACIEDSIYIYSENGFKGLLDMKGEVLVEADTYTDIAPCSKGMVRLSRNKEFQAPDDYAYFNNSGGLIVLDSYAFDPDSIKITEDPVNFNAAGEVTEVAFNLDLPANITVGEGTKYCDWDKIEPITAGTVGTAKQYSAIYKAAVDNSYYYICVDKFYNYTIYNGSYGLIRLKVGDVYGECYIFDYTDYHELEKMLESFGDSPTVNAPSKDEGLDFIQIEMGYATGNLSTVTLSADGFCLTDKTTSGDTPMNKYFSMLDKESFVSLVQWVDQVLSREYAGYAGAVPQNTEKTE